MTKSRLTLLALGRPGVTDKRANPSTRPCARYDADGGSQSVALPGSYGAVEYFGSTTGTSFDNEICSPLQVTWRVRPTCGSLDKASLDAWCSDNVFDEDHAQGVRPLVTSPELLAWIE